MRISIFRILLFCVFISFIALNNSCSNKIESHGELSFQTLIEKYPYYLDRIWNGLDLDTPGLETVRRSVQSGNDTAACIALCEYYRKKAIPAGLQLDAAHSSSLTNDSFKIVEIADQILQDMFTFQGISGKVEKFSNGNINWAYNGPKGDKEWGWFLNRHYIFIELLNAYQLTGNSKYVTYFDALIIDWVLSNPMPEQDLGTPQWRVMEVGTRMLETWPQIFYGFYKSPEFSISAKILMLSSIVDHEKYILAHHENHYNHAVKEMNGLAHAAVCFPEFKKADNWLEHAIEVMTEEVHYQVYPDGVQKELASSYHRNVFKYWLQFVDIVINGEKELSTVFMKQIEKMGTYLAYSMKPTGFGIQNNDSDYNYNRNNIVAYAKDFQREDWLYIGTEGKYGQHPDGLPSKWFPWAGQLLMRNGWDTQAQWGYFDIGPWGAAHQHNDKLHLSISAYGRDLLVDAGRYVYQKGPFRTYFVSSQSHNVVLIEGKGQNKREKEWSKPSSEDIAIQEDFDFALSSFTSGFEGLKGTAIHRRAVLYIRNEYWVVADQIITENPRSIEALWHFSPECSVKMENGSAASVDPDKGNIRIQPVSNLQWQSKVVKGQTTPSVQGWWSRDYNHKEPNPVAIFSSSIPGSTVFAWILAPAKGLVPNIQIHILPSPKGTIRFRVEGKNHLMDEIAICMDELTMISLSNGYRLNGRMVWLREGKVPRVVGGTVEDNQGRIICEHVFDR